MPPIGCASGARAAVGPHPVQLGQHLVEAVERVHRPQAGVDLGHDSHREARDRGAQDDPRRHGQRVHARGDVGVDEPRRLPHPVDVDAVLEIEPGQRLAQNLGRDAVQERGHGIGRTAIGSAPWRAASTAIASALPPVPWQ